ncbi:hypothetical protein B0H19DRAFT_1256740 [Mycena capillaripes]|nr:hypothetical protein B0H19DRAFT_1256740 [Mycena capillaripes]
MSASVRKDTITVIGVHRVPAHLSKREFEENVDRLVESLLALPEAKNLLSLNVYRHQNIIQIFQNNHVEASMKELGYPPAQPCVLLMPEFETADNLAEWLHSPALKQLLSDADQFHFVSGSTAASMDAVTRIDVPTTLTAAERNLWVGIYPGPGTSSPGQFKENMGVLLDAITALPVSQKNLLKHTTWMINDSIAPELQSIGFPAAQPVVIVMVELEGPNWDPIIEICADAELKRLILKANQDFGLYVDSICFGADVFTKIKNI